MRRFTTVNSIIAIAFGFAITSGGLTGCTNTNYVDLMRVSAQTDETIMLAETRYADAPKVSERFTARNQIITLRQKQVYIAERINVSSMPAVKDKSMTAAQGKVQKEELIAAAQKRLVEAESLPLPTATPAK